MYLHKIEDVLSFLFRSSKNSHETVRIITWAKAKKKIQTKYIYVIIVFL